MKGPGVLVLLGLALAIAYASTTRLVGIDFLHPQFTEPDHFLVSQAEFLWEGGNPKAAPLIFYWYPSLLAQALTLTPDPAYAAARKDPDSLEEQLEAASIPVVRMRLFVAWLSLLLVPGTFLLARRFLGAWASLLAAALVATSFLLLLYSTQARPHVPQATFALASVLAALRLRRRPTLGAYVLAGLAFALAVGCLQNGKFLLAPLLVAHVLRRRDSGARMLGTTLRLGALLLPAIASQLWFGPSFNESQPARHMARAPYGRNEVPPQNPLNRRFTDPLAVRDGAIHLGPQRLELAWYDGAGFGRMARFLAWNDPVLLLLCVLGLVRALPTVLRALRRNAGELLRRRGPPWRQRVEPFVATERSRDLWVALSFAVPYFCALGVYGETWARFLSPLVPFLACLAAFGAVEAHRLWIPWLRTERAQRGAAAAWAVAVLAFPTFAGAHRAWLHTQPDTVELASAWIAQNLEPGSHRILLEESLTLNLFYERAALEQCLSNQSQTYSRWLCYQDLFLGPVGPDRGYSIHVVPQRREVREQLRRVETAVDFVLQTGAHYAVIEVSHRSVAPRAARKLHEAVQAVGASVAVFSPTRGDRDDFVWADYQDGTRNRLVDWKVGRNLQRSALGPRIEIYELGDAITVLK